MECDHIHVVKQVNHGTWEKDVYRCEECNRLLSGKLELLEIKVTEQQPVG